MEGKEMALGNLKTRWMDPGTSGADHPVTRNGTCSTATRVRVDGKFLARGRQRLRIHGATYGPFAPGADGQPFPTPEAVREDLARMRAAGMNSVRTYHVPPKWLLDLADECAMTLFIDVPC